MMVRVSVVILAVLTLASSASAECAWVLVSLQNALNRSGAISVYFTVC
jgi:hypothetical protein